MKAEDYGRYLSTLKRELIPALGCTEPIAIALASAKAVEVLGSFPASLQVYCSGNIIKNTNAVTVPNSGGLKGIDAAATLGAVGGDASRSLEVLSGVTQADIDRTKELLAAGFSTTKLVCDVNNLYVRVLAECPGHSAEVTIANHHTQIVRIVKDRAVLLEEDENSGEEAGGSGGMSLDGILQFAKEADIADVKELLDSQIHNNLQISEYGLHHETGAQIGRILMENAAGNVKERARARAAAGSDARMAGCPLPVVINSGSGNQGITVSLPVLEYAEHLGSSREELYRALIISNLVAIYIKAKIGSLSSFCGAVTAGCGAGAAITYLSHGSRTQIFNTIINMLMNVSGILCDGAKASCAAKIASAVDAAVMAHEMSMKGMVFSPGDGLVQDNIEDTIKAVVHVAKEGMRETDVEILHIMTKEVQL